MKVYIKRGTAIITFEYPLQFAKISCQFTSIQLQLQAEVPGWSTTATRQKLISDYWFIYVTQHFVLIYGFASLLALLLQGGFGHLHLYLLSALIAGLLSFPVLYFFHYRPYFTAIFLPRLETVKESYDRKELEQLEKCRKAQLPNPSLILIHYVMDKASGMNAIQASDKFSGQLMKLYGVDPRSLKANMDLLLGSSIKSKGLSLRRSTEMSNRFSEAYQFFEDLKFITGVEILKEQEQKFFGYYKSNLK